MMGEKELEWQLNILAAEDTPSDVELFEIALKKCGNVRSLQIVRDGQEVIDYLQGHHPFTTNKREPPNVIFMDLKMPRLTGFEVLQWLRKHPECSVIPVVIMSSSSLEDDVLQAYRLGANAFFEKPTNFEQLQSIIRSILTFWSHAKRPPVNKFPC
jgi:CheY-like chemotaxis protein